VYRDEEEDKTIYKVVLNHEEQYSIWPAYRENPLGWRDAGKSGPKAECLAYIKEVWTDMRPLSLRKRMEELAQEKQQQQRSLEQAEDEK
jgi:MbtH protein